MGASWRPFGGLQGPPGASGEALGGVQEGPKRVCKSIEASEGVWEASSRPPGWGGLVEGLPQWKFWVSLIPLKGPPARILGI